MYYIELYLGNTYSLILILRLHAQYFLTLTLKERKSQILKKL